MGQQILRDSGLNFTIADGMKDGATKSLLSREAPDERPRNEKTRLIVQGFTGREVPSTPTMIQYGTNVVGGVTPGKGGTQHLERPVFDTVTEAVKSGGRKRFRNFRAASIRR